MKNEYLHKGLIKAIARAVIYLLLQRAQQLSNEDFDGMSETQGHISDLEDWLEEIRNFGDTK